VTIISLKKENVNQMFRKISIVIGIFIVLILSLNVIGQILSTLKSGERMDQATEKLHKLEVENRNLKNKLENVKSNDFIEEEARNKLGLAKEGEIIVVIPDETIDLILGKKKAEIVRLPNYLGWWKLFFN